MTVSRTFVAADYVVFSLMLFISAAIGIFYAHRGKKKNENTLGYLLANKSMTMIPVAISLTMSFQSSLTILAIPAEVYLYGTMISWVLILYILVSIITSEVFLPTFYRLGISSTYEYLELRFGTAARICGTVIFIMSSLVYCGIVIYGPALAFEAVTGFPLSAAIISTGIVCTLYTSVGGLKGVIWTDVFQGAVVIAGMSAFLIKGSIDLGGFSNVWKVADRGRRIDFFHFETDLRIRNTFWSIVTGGIIRWTGLYGVNQSQVQRYLSCKSERQAKLSIYLNVIGQFLLFSMAVSSGLLIYAYYETCDPLRSKCIGRPDQMYPFTMLDLFRDLPGASGLILSAVYAGSLSSVSSGVNAMATVAMQDLVKPYFKDRFTESGYLWMSKGVVAFFGLLCIAMSFALSATTELLQAALSLVGMLMGSLTGFFTLAIQFPFANSVGAISGLCAGIASTIWFYIGSRSIQKSNDLIRRLPLRIDGCSSTCDAFLSSMAINTTIHSFANTTTFVDVPAGTPYMAATTSPWLGLSNVSDTATMVLEDDDFGFRTLSYHLISAIGLGVSLVVGIIVSLATCGWSSRKDVDPRLLRPFFDHAIFRGWIPEKVRWYLRFGIDWKDNDPDPTRNGNYPMRKKHIPEKDAVAEDELFLAMKD